MCIICISLLKIKPISIKASEPFLSVPDTSAAVVFGLFTWLIAALGQITGLHSDPHVSGGSFGKRSPTERPHRKPSQTKQLDPGGKPIVRHLRCRSTQANKNPLCIRAVPAPVKWQLFEWIFPRICQWNVEWFDGSRYFSAWHRMVKPTGWRCSFQIGGISQKVCKQLLVFLL